jgi:hypothetical protein
MFSFKNEIFEIMHASASLVHCDIYRINKHFTEEMSRMFTKYIEKLELSSLVYAKYRKCS